ncbi:unnamed protein product [Sphacelaria rigidula]
MVSALLISDGNNNHGGLYGYAFSCGLISFAGVVAVMFLQMKGKGDLVDKFRKPISVFFLIWWLLGAAIGTFEGPFTTAGNGYFSAWIAFYASLKYAYTTSDKVRDFADRAVNAMKEDPAAGGSYGQDGGFDPQDQTEAYA